MKATPDTIVVGRFYLHDGTLMRIDPPLIVTIAVATDLEPPGAWLIATACGVRFAFGRTAEEIYDDVLVGIRCAYLDDRLSVFNVMASPASTE